jgi:hypothetical protein
MRTWNCVHGYAALILAAALIMTACGDAEGGPGGGDDTPPPPPPTGVNFEIDRADYLATGAQDFIFKVQDLSADPASVKVGATSLTYTRNGNKIIVTGGLNPNTLSDIEVKVGDETGTLKGMFTYGNTTPNRDKYTDLLTVISKGGYALYQAGNTNAYNTIAGIKTDVDNVFSTLASASENDIITGFAGNMSNYAGSWTDGINLAMLTILDNFDQVNSNLSGSGITSEEFKTLLIRIYMNKTNPANDAAIKAKVEADIKTSDVDTLAMLPPKGRLGAPGAGLA